MTVTTFDFGMIGLGVMGRNLLLNFADNGVAAAGYDTRPEACAALEANATAGTMVKGFTNLPAMVAALSSPKLVMLLVPAGQPVDDVLATLSPLLQPGDVIIDGGNSHFSDTTRRSKMLAPTGIHFVGMGVSGGEEGARRGPAMMPGGDLQAWQTLKPLLERIAAKAYDAPCVAHMGSHAAGHYVKMVHNGIEYAIMQIITEIYDVLKRGYGMNNSTQHQLFAEWNTGRLQSYLVEITADILATPNPDGMGYLVDFILDKAGSKGTGKWTSQTAMDLGVPIPNIDIAVSMRQMSAFKTMRVEAAALFAPTAPPPTADAEMAKTQAEQALYAATIIAYAQGLHLLQVASKDLDMQIPMANVVKIWRGGCIIRSLLLNTIYPLFEQKPQLQNMLLEPVIATVVQQCLPGLKAVVKTGIDSGIALPALQAALAYVQALSTHTLPINLLQAQRDYFGAHTFERVDKPGTFHHPWTQD
ncbi:MAG: NADP-dependent phosphogluconate dehydrogenase [Bacteroidetes bacterium]|nr:MAG: NADP-dependent phosphogluconate dehydrogenase [Bacteroidota bacterium]